MTDASFTLVAMLPILGPAVKMLDGKKPEKTGEIKLPLLGMLEVAEDPVEEVEPEVKVSLSQAALGFVKEPERKTLKGAKEITSQLLGIQAYRKTMKAMSAEETNRADTLTVDKTRDKESREI